MDLEIKNQEKVTLDELFEKSLRATNQIKTFLNSKDFDGLINYFTSFLNNFLNFNKKIYYKILKIKFLYIINLGLFDQAIEFYKDQVEIFIRESFSEGYFIKYQLFFSNIIKSGGSDTYLIEIFEGECENLGRKVFKPIFLYMTFSYMSLNKNSLISADTIQTYLTNYILNCDYVKNNHDISDIDDNEEMVNHSQRKASGEGKMSFEDSSINIKNIKNKYPQSVTSKSRASTVNEITKYFKPSFDKKENIDKKIIRKFRAFLAEAYKKKLIDFRLYDKNFWGFFCNENFLPPLKFDNPDTGEMVEFKSFSNNFIFWLFGKKGSKDLYQMFLNKLGNEFYLSIKENNHKLASNPTQQEQFWKYLVNFHLIYTGEYSKDINNEDHEMFSNYFEDKAFVDKSDEVLKHYVGNDIMGSHGNLLNSCCPMNQLPLTNTIRLLNLTD